MTEPQGLQLAPPDAAAARLEGLEAELKKREGELAALKRDLRQLQDRYLDQIGGLYAELSTLEADVFDAEVQAGLRPPPSEDDPADETGTGDPVTASCSSRAAPSDDLKRVFRDLAKAVHPDRAMDESARYRRHSLMAEANRAYAERDEDRLRLIMRAWERSAEAVVGDDAESERERVQRRAAAIDERLIAIEAEFAELRTSAIWRLKGKIDAARSQGWDLFAEMLLQVKRDISRATLRLASVRRQARKSQA